MGLALTGAPRGGGRGPVFGRPGWWRGGDRDPSGILYPDDALNTLLEELRRTVPLVDRSMAVLVRLCGGIEVEASASVRAELEGWLARVRVNQTGRGFQGFLEGHLDGMLMYGKGVGEMVPNRERTDLFALANLDPRSILFQVTEDPLVLTVLQRQRHAVAPVPLNRHTVVVSLNGGHVDRPHGVSLFRSVPFVARAARTIENATVQAWERLGAPPFHVNWQPEDAFHDPQGTLATEVLADLKGSWDKVMSAREPQAGSVTDFFTSGRVTVSVLGHEGTPFSISEPFRTFAEQIVCLTGLPAWLLGMHWSSTERLASQQAELIVAQIEGIRRSVLPQIEQIVETRQALAGKSGRYRLKWTPITLHDETEQARARAWRAQALEREIANATTLWHLGLINQAQAAQRIDPALVAVDRELSAPPLLPNEGNVLLSPEEGYGG